MSPDEYITAAKQAMNLESDNELALRLDINRARISAYRSGKEWPDNYVVIKLAIALNLDPVAVLADLESQREKRPGRAEFWRSFLLRAAPVVVLAVTLALSSTVISPAAAGRISGGSSSRYAKRVRIIWHYVRSTLSHAGRRLQEIMKPRDDSLRASPTPKKPASPCGLAQAPGIGARIVAGF